MGVLLTDEQKDIVSLFDDFMKNEVKPHLREIDASGEFPVDSLQLPCNEVRTSWRQ